MKPIKSYSRKELSDLVSDLGQPSFRAKQLYEWLYIHHVASYDAMTNLPASLRASLAEAAPLTTLETAESLVSVDGSRKYVFRLADSLLVESVGIPSADGSRLTVCFSTQVGCPMKCAFCATGTEGFTRNLTVGEMVDQVLCVQDDFGKRVSNVVAMGQGEPFLNYDATLEALHILNDPKGIAIGARHITVSTCGILQGIERFSHEREQFVLAVSLHSARQVVRNMLMPQAASAPLDALKRALSAYTAEKGRRISFEYLLLEDINDGAADFDALMDFCSGLSCHINFLPMNPVSGSPFQPSSPSVVQDWLDSCANYGIEATFRSSRGSDIQGACGQLKSRL